MLSIKDIICSTQISYTMLSYIPCSYYLNGRLAKEKDFILASRLDSFGATADRARKISLKYQPKSEIWLGETASTYNGGTAGLSDAYIAGFM